MKLLFLVLAGGGKEHLRDEKTQRITWATSDSKSHKVVWLKSGNKLFFDSESRTLLLPTEESNLLAKTIIATCWACENLDFDFIIRTNVSTYFHPERTANALRNYQFNKSSFGGYIQLLKNESDKHSNLYITGTGIVLGRLAAQMTAEMPSSTVNSIPDDIRLTNYLINQKELNLQSLNRLNLSSHHFFKPHYYIRCKTSWNPELASRRMLSIHKYFSSKHPSGRIMQFLMIYMNELRSITVHIWQFIDYLKRVRTCARDLHLNNQFRLP